MLFCNTHKQSGRLAAFHRLRLISLFFLALANASNAAEIQTLSIESGLEQPFLAQLRIFNAQSSTDISCFTLQQPPSADPIQLEYTTMSNQQGLIMLWSNSAISLPLKLTLIDSCQHSSQTLSIQADNSTVVSPPIYTHQASPPVIPVLPANADDPIAGTVPVQTGIIAPPTVISPDVPLDTYNALQLQIDALQADFKQLQTKSDTLYTSNLAQANVLIALKNQLNQLQNENHLLRTLVLTLSLGLIISGYFFADWLRRNAAIPKTAKAREITKENVSKPAQSGQSQPLDIPATAQHAKSNQGSDHQQATSHIQPPYQQTSQVTSRFQSVAAHANDDAVSPIRGPQNVSSQQSTNAVMQGASRLFTHGRINQAIEHLQQHLARHPKCSPWMWLYLLDLLSKEGKQQEFDIVAGDCRKHFNLSVERSPDLKQQGLESYPRIMKALQQTWGTPQVISLIDDLVYNTRLVPRMGFERSVFEELMMLKDVACQTQNLPTTQPASKASSDAETMRDNLRELQKLSGDIFVLAPVDQTPFQYWTDFTFELDDTLTARKSA